MDMEVTFPLFSGKTRGRIALTIRFAFWCVSRPKTILRTGPSLGERLALENSFRFEQADRCPCLYEEDKEKSLHCAASACCHASNSRMSCSNCVCRPLPCRGSSVSLPLPASGLTFKLPRYQKGMTRCSVRETFSAFIVPPCSRQMTARYFWTYRRGRTWIDGRLSLALSRAGNVLTSPLALSSRRRHEQVRPYVPGQSIRTS